MKVKRSSWNYRLWKRWHRESSEPTNLCTYFWFSVFQWTVGWVVLATFLAIVVIVLSVSWFFGFRASPKEYGDFCDYKYDLYNWEPRGQRYTAAPWEIVGALLPLFLIAVYGKPMLHACNTLFSEILAAILAIPKEFVYGCLWVLGIATAVVIFASALFYVYQNELVRSYLRAKKEKLCPRIEVVD